MPAAANRASGVRRPLARHTAAAPPPVAISSGVPEPLASLPWPAVAIAVAGVLVLCLVLGAWLGAHVRRFWLRRRLARRWRHARHGEQRARGWLERHDFRILDEQVSRTSTLIVDGQESPFTVRADYLVERDDVRAIVEVKTGDVADPSSRGTRRQILEYAWVYGVSEVFLFDADAERLHHIALPTTAREPAPAPHRWRPLSAAFAAGAALAALAALALWGSTVGGR